MRKVTTINLNNNAYQIDEEGYEALRAYLDGAGHALAGNPDREEILADLEQAIGDKCRLSLGSHKTVVSGAEIERILKEMGPVDGSGNAEPATGADESSPDNATQSAASAPHRMYRIYDGAIWSGVCTGMAAWLGVDVAFVRLAFILLTIASVGAGFLVYILMIVLVPKARTPAEKAAAYGQPFRAQEVVDRVRKKHADWRSDRQARRRMRQPWMSPAAASQPPPGAAARVTGGVLLPVLTVISAVWFAAMATVAYSLWQGWYQTDAWLGPHGSWHFHSSAKGWIALVAVIAVYALVAIPIGAGRRASRYYANGGRRHGWADAWSGMLWIAVVAVLLLGVWYLMPQLLDLPGQLLGQPVRGISV